DGRLGRLDVREGGSPVLAEERLFEGGGARVLDRLDARREIDRAAIEDRGQADERRLVDAAHAVVLGFRDRVPALLIVLAEISGDEMAASGDPDEEFLDRRWTRGGGPRVPTE